MWRIGLRPLSFSRTSVCPSRALRLQRPGPMEPPPRAEPSRTSVRSVSVRTVDQDELRRFQSLSNKWWDERGEFSALHSMNELRVPFVRDNLLNVHRGRHSGKPLSGLKILDVGCGGGLLSEPLGRLGASVLGIDPVEDSIRTAQIHSAHDPDLRDRVQYQACSLEELTPEQGTSEERTSEERASEEGTSEELEAGAAAQFDAVVASEVVEHLADLETFASCCSLMLKPGGSLFITTLNRTNLSWLLGIVAAEHILRIVPAGTHQWEKFISPEELERLLESNGFSVQSIKGMFYNPLSGAWSWTDSTAVNYALHAVKLNRTPSTTPSTPSN